MITGNDDWLLGQPKDLEEATDTVIAFYGEDYLRTILRRGIDTDQSLSLA